MRTRNGRVPTQVLKAAMESRGVCVSRSNGRSRFQGIGLTNVEG